MIYGYRVTQRSVTKYLSGFATLHSSAKFWAAERKICADKPNWTNRGIKELYYEDTQTNEFMQVYPITRFLFQTEILLLKLSATAGDFEE